MESSFGHDFSRVRVHTSAEAADSASLLRASAYTVGRDIVFAEGAYRPGSPAGRRLLAHELTHVVQQQQSDRNPGPPLIGGSSAAAEREAAGVADQAMAGRPISVRERVRPQVARRERPDHPVNELDFQVKLRRINRLLQYGLFDWAITDAEATEALELLESMNSTERATALTQISVERLRDNLPGAQGARLQTMLEQTKGARAEISQVRDLLSYGLFDWAITDEDAAQVLSLLQEMPPDRRMHALMAMDRKLRNRLYENLPAVGQQQLSEMWTESRAAWARQRQQGDPLEPGDRIQIHAYSPIGQQPEERLSRSYVVGDNYAIDFPMLGDVGVRGLRPDHIAARLEALLTDGFYRAIDISVEVVQRGNLAFEARDVDLQTTQPTTALEPGDTFELLVLEPTKLQNETDLSGNYQIDRRGYVKVEHLGLVAVGGLARDELNAHFHRRLEGWWHQPPVVWAAVTSHKGTLYSTEQLFRPIAHGQHSTSESIRKGEAERAPIRERQEIDTYLDFSRQKLAELQQGEMTSRDRQVSRDALDRYGQWLSDHVGDDKALSATSPWEVYGNIHTPLLLTAIRRESREKVAKAKEQEWEKEHSAAVEAKLDEYMLWAHGQWAKAAVRHRSVGAAYLLTEHSFRKIALDRLTSEVLTWAFSNTNHAEFLRMSPPRTAMRILDEDRNLKNIFDVGMAASPRIEYFPEFDRARYTLGEVGTETIVGMLPVIGEMSDTSEAVTGRSLTGHKLSGGERVLAAIGALIPFVPASALRGGKNLPDVVGDFAVATGRSADEIQSVFKVAGHLDAGHVRELDRIMGRIADGKKLTKADLDIVDDVAKSLRGPLEELASATRGGRAPKVGKLRADPLTAKALQPGTAEHMAQRWLEYQVSNPGTFPNISAAIDPKWRRAYNTVLDNKKAGGAFESSALGALGHKKNNAMMMTPDAGTKGFIPDAVTGNPTELVWGQAYRFTEIKGWKDMSMTGNLARMIEYVDEFEGHLEVVFRSAKHARGKTSLSGPLSKTLSELEQRGLATVRWHP